MINTEQGMSQSLKNKIIALIILAVAVAISLAYHFAPVAHIDKIVNPLNIIPSIPLGAIVDGFIDWLTDQIGLITRGISDFIENAMDLLTYAILWFPSFIMTILFSLLAWRLSSRQVALFAFIGLLLVNNMGYWTEAIETLSMIVISVGISVAIGVPVGILSTRSDLIHKIVWPILDFMQTMPAFVYLIPAVFFFGTGEVGGMIATIIFSMPPVIRLTGLGIRQVSQEVIEACVAFGSTDWQKLTKVQLPLGMPTIMAGINQCIMLALSMVVIASMIGAGGLGDAVRYGVSRVNIEVGFESGISVVILAIILDRITQSTRKQTEEEGE